jgi:hypothetical protein
MDLDGFVNGEVGHGDSLKKGLGFLQKPSCTGFAG